MATKGESLDINQARNVIDLIRGDINSFNCSYKTSSIEIDWGRSRSQGKRSGKNVTGAMSSNLCGIKKYTALDLGVYSCDWNGQIYELLDTFQLTKYYRARVYGCNEIEARYYALT